MKLIRVFSFLGFAGPLLLGGLFSSRSKWGLPSSRCTGFSLQWLIQLWNTDSRAHGLQSLWHMDSAVGDPWLQNIDRLSSCVIQVQLLFGMGDLPRPGIKLISALAGRFFTTELLGKPKSWFFKKTKIDKLLAILRKKKKRRLK